MSFELLSCQSGRRKRNSPLYRFSPPYDVILFLIFINPVFYSSSLRSKSDLGSLEYFGKDSSLSMEARMQAGVA